VTKLVNTYSSSTVFSIQNIQILAARSQPTYISTSLNITHFFIRNRYPYNASLYFFAILILKIEGPLHSSQDIFLDPLMQIFQYNEVTTKEEYFDRITILHRNSFKLVLKPGFESHKREFSLCDGWINVVVLYFFYVLIWKEQSSMEGRDSLFQAISLQL